MDDHVIGTFGEMCDELRRGKFDRLIFAERTLETSDDLIYFARGNVCKKSRAEPS